MVQQPLLAQGRHTREYLASQTSLPVPTDLLLFAVVRRGGGHCVIRLRGGTPHCSCS